MKKLSIEADGYDEVDDDLAQDMNDLLNKFLSMCRQLKAKQLERKIADNRLRQPSVQPTSECRMCISYVCERGGTT